VSTPSIPPGVTRSEAPLLHAIKWGVYRLVDLVGVAVEQLSARLELFTGLHAFGDGEDVAGA
jgi:hypothetical protein